MIIGKLFSGCARSVRGFDCDDIVRGGLFLACGAYADVTGVFAKLSEVSRAQVAHAGLDTADEFAQHAPEIRRILLALQCLLQRL